jgi:hypothetical protein
MRESGILRRGRILCSSPSSRIQRGAYRIHPSIRSEIDFIYYNDPMTHERGSSGEVNHYRALFDLGQVVGTPGALQAIQDADQNPLEFLVRHVTGDWGDNLSDEDKKENNISVGEGYRILSAYELNTGVKIWLITEWDRSVTTYLLPQEY